jgi:hypothetical protein
MKTIEESTRGNRYISWILRGSLFLVALFYLLFSFDVFSIEVSFWQRFERFLIHNIYTLVMFLILYIAWESENLAGFLLVGMSISMVFFFGGPSDISRGTWIMISLTFVVGLVFLCNYFLIKKKS